MAQEVFCKKKELLLPSTDVQIDPGSIRLDISNSSFIAQDTFYKQKGLILYSNEIFCC